MIKKSLLTTLIVLGCLFMGGNLTGQTTVQIGNGTSLSYQIPFNTRQVWNYSEFIYSSSLINQTENKTIKSIAFSCTGNLGGSSYTFDLYMKNDTKTSYSSNSDYAHMSSDDIYFTGTITLPSTSEYVTIELDKAFEYDYQKSLIIAINRKDKTQGTTSYGVYCFNYTSNSTYNYSIFYAYNTGDSPYNPTTISAGGVNLKGYPNIIITFDDGDSCITPSGLAAETTSASTANVSWTAGGDEEEWTLEYSTDEDFSVPANITTIEDIMTTSQELTGLDENTTYYVRVKAVCGVGDESGWTDAMNFTTLCSESIPYSYDFEDADVLDCWTIRDAQENTGWSNSTHGVDNSKCFQFYGKLNTICNQYLITPELSDVTNGVRVSFKYKWTTSTKKLYVGYSTNYDTESFTWSDELSSTTPYLSYEHIFPSSTKYIAIKCYTDGVGQVYIDDFSITNTVNAFITDGNWNESTKWSNGTVPSSSDNIIIASAVTIPNSYVAQANNITIDGGSLTIADGGQLVCNNTVSATVHKTIAGHDGSADKGWHFIASPVADDIDPLDVDELINATAANYDLYRFNQNPDQVINGNPYAWENYKAHTDGFNLTNGQGYLYANANGADLIFTGEINPGTSNTYSVSVLLAYSGEASTKGWNLVGNPFTCNATLDYPCYTISDDGRWANASGSGTTIAPGTGVMVRTTEGEQSVTFTKAPNTTPDASSNSNSIQLVLSQTINHRGTNTTETLDNAIVSFNQGSELSKFYFGTQNANIYIPQNGREFAIVTAGNQGQVPVNFRAHANGQYTLNFKSPLTSNLSSLTLIDNLTGAHVDLLQTPSYTFQGNTTDISARFRLLFTTTGVDENDDENQTDFAFISDGQLIVNGNGTLYVYDALGRQISAKQVTPLTSNLLPLTTGVYVLQLVNGNSMRTQKIIVK